MLIRSPTAPNAANTNKPQAPHPSRARYRVATQSNPPATSVKTNPPGNIRRDTRRALPSASRLSLRVGITEPSTQPYQPAPAFHPSRCLFGKISSLPAFRGETLHFAKVVVGKFLSLTFESTVHQFKKFVGYHRTA